MTGTPLLLGGRYELGPVLGRGGMAEVHLGRDLRLGRSVAIKLLRADLARDPTFLLRFRREAQSAASLNHPAVVAVYDTGEDDVAGTSLPYIVMEHVEGSTLRQLLSSGHRFLPERALEVTAGVLAALDYSHRHGIVHRDIKPGNVMLTPAGNVKVMDFGIARALADSSSTVTQTAAVIGTAQYLSPEQARGEPVDARSDIYSTGCLLYELLTGRPPFVGDSPVAVAYQHVREQPRPPSALEPDLPPYADAIPLKALEKDPGARYASATQMREDIDRALQGRPLAHATGTPGLAPATATVPTLPPPPPPPRGGGSPPRRSPPTSTVPAASGSWPYPPAVPAPPTRSRGGGIGRTLGWLLSALLVAAVLAGSFLLGRTLGEEGGQVPVPNLRDATSRRIAEGRLEDAGLRGRFVNVSDEEPSGHVVSQDPPPGRVVEEDTVVTVRLSSGPGR